MARKTRVHYFGAMYHVIVRGNSGEQIFFTNNDRKYFYSLIEEGVERFNYQVHAFCLMSNHIHLALQVGDIPLSKIVQNFSFRYACRINKIFARAGHLFQGRFKAILVDTDNYLLELIRYIHLNPVRANLVTQADEYSWSSHRAYLGDISYLWLNCNLVLDRFSKNRPRALLQYEKFMQKRSKNDLQKKFEVGNQKGFSILSDDNFMKKIYPEKYRKISSNLYLEKLVKNICAYYSINEGILNSSRTHSHAKIRAKIAWLANDLKICNLNSVAIYFNRGASGMVRTIQQLIRNEEALIDLYDLRRRIEKSTN